MATKLICPNGHEVSQSWKFCGVCGFELVKVERPSCPSCGAMRWQECFYCPHCGEKYPVKEE